MYGALKNAKSLTQHTPQVCHYLINSEINTELRTDVDIIL
jgi:hypothetical protein